MRPLERRLAIGNAVHAGLEWSARNGWREPGEERLLAALASEGLDGDLEAIERVERAGRAAGSAASCARELDGARVRPELPFALEIGGAIVRGKIDLLAELSGGELVVVDYKTDELAGRAASRARRPLSDPARRLRARRRGDAADREAEHPPLRSAYSLPRGRRRAGGRDARCRGLGGGPAAARSDRRADRGGEFARTEKPEPATLLRLPGGGAALRRPGVAATGAGDRAAHRNVSSRDAPGRLRLRLPGQPRQRRADARSPGRPMPDRPAPRLAPPLVALPRQRALREDVRAGGRRLAAAVHARPQHRAGRRAGGGAERGPDRAHRGGARPAGPARDPLRPGRRHRIDRPARTQRRDRLRQDRRVRGQTGEFRSRPTRARSSSPTTRPQSRRPSPSSARANAAAISRRPARRRSS